MNKMNPQHLNIQDFDYSLPDERIAKYPMAERDRCKLLVRSGDGALCDHIFTELPSLLPKDSMLVYNNTRVINARLHFRKQSNTQGEGAQIEVFCLEPAYPRDYAQNFASTRCCSWLCFVGNSKKWKNGILRMSLEVSGRSVVLTAERESVIGNSSQVKFMWDDDSVTFATIIGAAGEIPIPPYLNRDTEDSDSKDYQTIFSHIDGSVAAPTAGLHFTDEVLQDITQRGIPRRELTLHVGAGTFQPVKSDNIGEHMMHAEFIAVNKSLIEELARSQMRVIAVGTTSVRTLESLYHIGCLIHQGTFTGEVPQWYPYEDNHPQLSIAESMECVLKYLVEHSSDILVASTRIIIAPGYEYKVVKGMVTNFHQPRSTLLLLISAFVGGNWQQIYDHALENGYRFLSYGDACLFLE